MIEKISIKVNQVGYPLHERKAAVFVNYQGSFEVIEEESGKVVYSFETGPLVSDRISGSTVSYGEFSRLTQTGRYYIRANEEFSSRFEVKEKPFDELHQSLLKAFYFYRCGADLPEEFAGEWTHKACHTKPGIVYSEPSRKLDCNGGWHDAGDYGKYVVPGAKAVADLFLAYELFPTAFQNAIPIPETDNKTPDVLLECRYELEWLLKMQDTHTGGVFHKLTTLEFPGLDVMPENDLGDLYLSPISATATGCFAAIMAHAARVYQSYDQVFANRCLEAALLSWGWLQANPKVSGFNNPKEIVTGEYGDEVDIDERYWAAAELYRTTGQDQFHQEFLMLAKENFPKYSLGWADVGGYGTIAYLLHEIENGNCEVYQELAEGLLKHADELVKKSNNDGYFISLQENEYIWGSNMEVMNNGMILLIAELVSGKSSYSSCALDHVHYLLGRNVLDISYVTGHGSKRVLHPHHRPSVGDHVADPIPGLVIGGPNSGLQDECAKEHLKGMPPARCFIDHQDSYSTNEVTIYWNSPAVFVVSRWV
ncbi:glycoside hydrolase [Anaerobacillus alkaliphilus]|uniref:Endoglucanase n=1 Tax=Anaerobacillus alkaliphilus TaxID=1548597 RepID=A0A4Q0VTX3_9BACI|nr:glycoside hydrolase family 9 protein [Anaerobacillus alkaliphilus]RXJ02090.1 glycoside hydrolase [Anaerobacillus alkaliphilus]